jgi:hypothetical protein
MKYKFHPDARAEFFEAVAYYESCEPGLGPDFYDEVMATIDNIVAHPLAWSSIDGEIRRCLVHRFPFGVVYSDEGKYILLVAVMHLRRAPGYWKYRLQ